MDTKIFRLGVSGHQQLGDDETQQFVTQQIRHQKQHWLFGYTLKNLQLFLRIRVLEDTHEKE